MARESYKPILVGKGAALVKKVGIEARQDIEKLVGTKVYLNLEVLVREDWFNNKKMMKELGYVVNED